VPRRGRREPTPGSNVKEPVRPRPKRALSQHFLHDPGVLDRIIAAAGIQSGDTVLEIGSGPGALTERLAAAVGGSGRVLAVEIDRDLIPKIEELATRFPAVQVVPTDFLAAPLTDVLASNGVAPPVAVVGNLPYSITTPILERLLDDSRAWTAATLMVQEEVARRIAVPPGSPGCGSISVWIHYRCVAEYCFRVGAGAFHPPPRVRSAVIRLIPRSAPPVHVVDELLLSRVTRAAFGQRRKTLLNALSSLGASRPEIASALDFAGIDSSRRGETLTLEELARLVNALAARLGANPVTAQS